MIFEIIQYSVVSLIFIAIVHYLISHLTDNLTTPQVRDIVTSTNEHYEAIIKRLESGSTNKPISVDMKDDLKNYLKGLNGSARSVSNQNNEIGDVSVSSESNMNPNSNTPSYLKSEPSSSALMTYDGPNDFSDYDGNAYADY